MKNKKLTLLVERLERIFPHLKLYYEGEYFDIDVKGSGKLSNIEKIALWEGNYAPPHEYDWYDIIRILKENGLEIKNIK